ncbi:GNAT family N-acetyltransferase [Caballeronia cordobensis]|uniref:GNAT family N-acetyltransferase n=1 Tax=Caballeronia cordobensis TaxID=1353886 RepID=UPI00045EFAEB|nr:GCN5-related N-acetyltransferase [Burkholderia sp. RPE67]
MAHSSIALTVQREGSASIDGRILLVELSAMLVIFSGDGGQSRFDLAEFRSANGMFYVARTALGEPVGCGVLRRFDASTVELKRIYSRQCASGIGTAIVRHLEADAAGCGYRRLVLERERSTSARSGSTRATDSVRSNGMALMSASWMRARCLEKSLSSTSCAAVIIDASGTRNA